MRVKYKAVDNYILEKVTYYMSSFLASSKVIIFP